MKDNNDLVLKEPACVETTLKENAVKKFKMGFLLPPLTI